MVMPRVDKWTQMESQYRGFQKLCQSYIFDEMPLATQQMCMAVLLGGPEEFVNMQRNILVGHGISWHYDNNNMYTFYYRGARVA